MNLRDFRDTVAAMGEGDGPTMTVSLDLSRDATGRPAAHSSFRAALSAAVEAAPELQAWAEELREAMDATIDEALEEGARGLFVVVNDATSLRLDTPLPFRNHLRLGSGPWTFELERQSFLLARPVVAVDVTRSEARIVRVAEAVIGEVESIDRDEHWTRKTHGRTAGGSSGAQGTAAGGRHSRSNVQRSVEERRGADAREAADAIGGAWSGGDLLMVAGTPEPRLELIRELPDRIRGALVSEEPHELPTDERALQELVADLSARHQLAEGDRLAAEILSGAGENIARGRVAVEEQFNTGRVGAIVFHEDAVRHWGSASDARVHMPQWDDGDYDRLAEKARETDAEILFCRLEKLLSDHEGVAATLRW